MKMDILGNLTGMTMRQKAHLAIGVVALVLGIYGVYDEYFNVIDFLKGASPLIFIAVGLVALVAGLTKKIR
ncbi:hypothetical protein WDW37_06835 [Bdellovibrionota bacterium FG-1]